MFFLPAIHYCVHETWKVYPSSPYCILYRETHWVLFPSLCLHCDASHRYLCCLSTYIYSRWLKFVSRHIHDPAIVPPSLIAGAKKILYSVNALEVKNSTGIIDYSPTKSYQREQRANTYPFEKLRFFIHSGLILFALTLWESQNIGPLIRTHYPVGVVLWQSRSNDPLMGEHNIFE